MNIIEYIKYKLNKKEFKLKREAKRLAWLSQYQFNTVVDVGANEGQFAEKILCVFPHANIYCFEPLPPVYQKLKLNFEKRANVHPFNFGLGAFASEMSMQYNEYSPSSSLLEMLELHKSNFDFAVKSVPIAIQIRTLDSFFMEPVTGPMLLKVDVQGYEMPVLQGADSILQQASVIILETCFYPLYKDQYLFEDLYEYLVKKGFRYVGSVEQLVSPKNQQILTADAVFIKK